MAAPWDVSGGVYASKSMSVTSQETTPRGLTFSADGTKAYVCGDGGTVYQYTLTTAWDISTGSYASKSMSVSTQDGTPGGVFLSSDGTKAYVVGTTNATVYQYTLSTAWDISTGSYASKSMSVSTQDANANDLAFSSDGTKCYIAGNTNDKIFQYALSTAWDISTGSYASKSLSVTSQETQPGGVFLSSDGTKAYVVGHINDTIYQYTLTTAWDISTGSYASKSLSVTTEETLPFTVSFSSDGTKAYVVGAINDTVYQYTLATPYTLTGTVTDPSGTVVASADVRILNTTADPYTEEAQVTADGSGVYTLTVYSNTDTFQAVSSAVGPPRRFGASDNNLTAT